MCASCKWRRARIDRETGSTTTTTTTILLHVFVRMQASARIYAIATTASQPLYIAHPSTLLQVGRLVVLSATMVVLVVSVACPAVVLSLSRWYSRSLALCVQKFSGKVRGDRLGGAWSRRRRRVAARRVYFFMPSLTKTKKGKEEVETKCMSIERKEIGVIILYHTKKWRIRVCMCVSRCSWSYYCTSYVCMIVQWKED